MTVPHPLLALGLLVIAFGVAVALGLAMIGGVKVAVRHGQSRNDRAAGRETGNCANFSGEAA